jgi:hypothetical protein
MASMGSHETGVIFVVEPPNLFRDSVDDAQNASDVLVAWGSARRHGSVLRWMRDSMAERTASSPIDVAWTAIKVVQRRIRILEAACEGGRE